MNTAISVSPWPSGAHGACLMTCAVVHVPLVLLSAITKVSVVIVAEHMAHMQTGVVLSVPGR